MQDDSKKLTVVHVSTQQTWHGGEGQAYHLMSGLRARGHRVVVCARRGGAFAGRARDEQFEVFEVLGRGRRPDCLWKMRQWLKRISPDVIHSHDGHALTASGLACWGLDVGLRVASRRVDFPIRSVSKFTRLADVVVAISGAVASECRRAGIPDSRLRIVHSGVDPGRVQAGNRQRGRDALSVTTDETLLLTVANLTEHKGHTYLLQAMPRLLRGNPKLRLALAGNGELEMSLRRQTSDLGISQRVDFLGYRQDVPDLIQAADVFVMPSILEGLCTSVLDAMFAGIPVVTTGAGGLAEAVGVDLDEGPVAYLARPRDPESLAEAIERVVAARDEAQKTADRACARASSMFTHERMIEGTLSVYREFLGRKRTCAA